MKKLFVLALIGLAAAGCTQTERGATLGATSGAIIGGLATGDVRGVATGALIGGATGAIIGAVSEQPGQCYYRDARGRQYIDACPANYRPVVVRPRPVVVRPAVVYRPAVVRPRPRVVVTY